MSGPTPRDPAGAAPGPTRLLAGGAVTSDERSVAELLARLPDLEADPAAVARLQRRVFAPARRASAPPVWALASAALLLGLFLLWPAATRSARQVEIAASAGGVFDEGAAHGWETAGTGAKVGLRGRIHTDVTGRSLARIPGLSSMLIAAQSDVRVEQLTPGVALRLDAGAVTLRVTKRPPGEPFLVKAGPYTVIVVGTLFTVEQSPGLVAVSVAEGVVSVSDGHVEIARVRAGERWTSAGGPGADRTPRAVADALAHALAGDPESALAADLVAIGSAGPASSPAPTLPGPAASAGVATVSGAAPSSVVASVQHDLAKPRPTEDAPPPPSTSVDAPKPVENVSAAPDAAAPDAAPRIVPSAPTDAAAAPTEDAFTRATALEAAGDVQGAARAFELATREPAHADLALYSLGRLYQRRLADPRRALSAFHRYRDAYPQGPLLPEVDFAILELLVEGRDHTAALTEATRFLGVHASSERALEVHFLRANLLRDSGDCRGAMLEYQGLERGRYGDDALYSTAYCQRKLGDRDAAAATLRSYLQRFPRGAHSGAAGRALESGNEIEN